MMRLSDIIGRISPSAMLIVAALVLFVLVFVAVLVYAYILLGRDTIKHFASIPFEDESVYGASAEQIETSRVTPTEQAEMT